MQKSDTVKANRNSVRAHRKYIFEPCTCNHLFIQHKIHHSNDYNLPQVSFIELQVVDYFVRLKNSLSFLKSRKPAKVPCFLFLQILYLLLFSYHFVNTSIVVTKTKTHRWNRPVCLKTKIAYIYIWMTTHMRIWRLEIWITTKPYPPSYGASCDRNIVTVWHQVTCTLQTLWFFIIDRKPAMGSR